jgi:hypothetical protein
MPEVRHVNASLLFVQIVKEGQTSLQHWIG